MASAALDPAEIARYARQLVLPQVGMPGQARLSRSRVLVVGAGGLGSPALLYLAAAGVGTVGVVDDDVVDTANLHRQVVHAADAVGRPKTRSAAEGIRRISPSTTVVEHAERFRPENALGVVRGYDVVVDASDNFETRYAVSDACVALGLAHVWGCVLGFEGQASVWWAGHGPCYRCVFPDRSALCIAPSCEQAGVLGSVCAAIGSVQATETLKLLLGVGEPLVGRVLVHDALRQAWDSVPVRPDPACPSCGEQSVAPFAALGHAERAEYDPVGMTDGAPPAGAPGPAQGAGATPEGRAGAPAAAVTAIEPADLAAYLESSGALLIDVRDESERAVVAIPGSVVVHLEQFRSGTAFTRPELADRARPFVVYCLTGRRSEQAARLGRRAGYPLMASLRGGVLEWLRVAGPWRGAT